METRVGERSFTLAPSEARLNITVKNGAIQNGARARAFIFTSAAACYDTAGFEDKLCSNLSCVDSIRTFDLKERGSNER